jgi:hypothetical protein
MVNGMRGEVESPGGEEVEQITRGGRERERETKLGPQMTSGYTSDPRPARVRGPGCPLGEGQLRLGGSEESDVLASEA